MCTRSLMRTSICHYNRRGRSPRREHKPSLPLTCPRQHVHTYTRFLYMWRGDVDNVTDNGRKFTWGLIASG